MPSDFDYCGLVTAHYAIPPEELGIESVTERLFRGYGRSMKEYEQPFQQFRANKAAIFNDIQSD